ncbi:OprO/OprP family phosphate-selective porin [Robertkochia aurantiaca]|uniref:OprO/OprP family phosphate-selective porin n=1 Tax=Robertkochia aurantiaca TaxID=2873700 RepID=UPI001CCE4ABA|nr:porin [Robertkochia sp. 3YJGBD-33]
MIFRLAIQQSFCFCLVFALGLLDCHLSAQESADRQFQYTNKGFQFRSADDRFLLQIESRLQFRYAYPQDQDPITFEDFQDTQTHVFEVNRARLKIGGHAYKPWLKYYWEYDVVGGNLLDFRVMIEKWDFLKFKVGQWKTYFTRERVISSGKQQLVDRSIINRPFTVDRQQGVEVYGRIFPERLFDLSYNISVLTGTGRGNSSNDDEHLMYVGRLQWNVFGRELGFTGSDLSITKKPEGIIAFAGVTNRSPYTRFSTSGGGQLVGFEDGVEGQYRVNQLMLETAFMYRGFSWQHESHYKEIQDRVLGQTTVLEGSYLQAGYFLHQAWGFIPEPLEIAARYAWYTPEERIIDNLHKELGFGLNWFFAGHRNKLTAEVTWFELEGPTFPVTDEVRVRVQWDISF